MRKTLFLLLVILCVTFAGCGSSDTVSDAESNLSDESIQEPLIIKGDVSINKELFSTENIDFSIEGMEDRTLIFVAKNKTGHDLNLRMGVSLDGVMTNNVLSDYLLNSKLSEQRIEFRTNVKGTDHEKLSLVCDVLSDNEIIETQQVCDFPLGGDSNPKKLIQADQLYETDEFKLLWAGSGDKFLRFSLHNKTEKYINAKIDNILVDNKQIAGTGTGVVVGHSAGYVSFWCDEPIFAKGSYKRISLDLTPYINSLDLAPSVNGDNHKVLSIIITADSADPDQINIQVEYKSTQTESDSTVSDTSQDTPQTESDSTVSNTSQDTPKVDSAFDSTILGYASLLKKTKEEIGLSDEQKVEEHYYYLGTGMFLNEERSVYIYIDDEESNRAFHLKIGDPGDYPSMDEMKEQLNKIYGEPEFESDQRCRYYDKENYLKISIVKSYLPTEEDIQTYTEVIISPYKYNRNK